MSVKTQFSIKDLENLSGVKAHTIRIWEKRYNLLEPDRTDTNIRQYDLLNLKKLLNVTFLYNHGYKISKIAGFKENEIKTLVQNLGPGDQESFAIQEFKKAMFEFDHALFATTYEQLTRDKSFDEIFYEVFIPLLDEIGTLWLTGTIDPVHERFTSELIKQKIILNIHSIRQKQKFSKPPEFALFLPHEEIHEIGLLFANYLLLKHGHNTIYLGSNIPLENLTHLLKHYSKITFLSYLTVKPDDKSVADYVQEYLKGIGNKPGYSLWLMGSKIQTLQTKDLPKRVEIIYSLKQLESKILS